MAFVLQSDGYLLKCCLDGHPEAYAELVARYQAPLTAYLAGRLRDPELAEEIAQEAFVRAYCALGKLRKRNSFFPWLVGIAQRAAKEEHRKRLSHVELDEAAAVATPDAAPTEKYEVERAVAELGEPYRDVILLCYYGGLSCAEVAERLGVPIGTVTKRLSRAYTKLRDRLRPSRNA